MLNKSCFFLTLAELEACACLGASRLFALHNAGVAGEEALVFEGFLVLFIDFHKCACNGESESLALTCKAATVEVHLDVILLSNVEQVQGLLDNILEDG